MKIAVPRETPPQERRVALVPEAAARLLKEGWEVHVENGAGAAAGFRDAAYAEAGATLNRDSAALVAGADVVLRVQGPTEAEVAHLREGAVLIGFLAPHTSPERLVALAGRRVTAFAMELVPRITRAQSMDALSSQATVAGYRASLLAAQHSAKFFPMLTTAAGTVAPARVLVLGAGVAGLMAMATARRLGAVVEGFDIRSAAREQVESLGAKWVGVVMEEAEGAGGYAKEVSEEAKQREHEHLTRLVAEADVVITTAQVPGRRAPLLVTEEMVVAMRPGSVIVDLAADTGGNCALTVAGETVARDGVTILGPVNLPATLPFHASQMYARNVGALLKLLVKDGALRLDFDDEIIRACCVTHAGEVLLRGA
jgi:H+-translocating NAD(P) transhydrogenase subunit alpha